MTQKITSLITLATLSGILNTPSFGAGFQLQERSISGLGRAFSGEAAIADDASVLSSNAAGIILLDNSSYSIGLQYIHPNVDVDGTRPLFGPVQDSDVANSAAIPHFYYTRKISPNISAGIGFFSGFGLATDYSDSFSTLVGTDLSEITTITINPSLAIRFNDHITFGVGLNILHASGRLTNTAGGATVFDLEGDDLALGWNTGILYEINTNTRIGLHYRSSIDLQIEGDAKLGPPLALSDTEVDATLNVELPDSLELSFYHALNNQWAIHADIIWTNWSKFKTLAPKTETPADPALVVQENWRDAFRFAVGTTYKHNEHTTLRAGIALDESPVSTFNRTLRIPDGNRIWLSLGATIKLNASYNLDIGYTHIFADENTILLTTSGGNEPAFFGKAGGDVDLIGIGISGHF